MIKKISVCEVKKTVAEYNYLINCSNCKNDWRIIFDGKNIKITSKIEESGYQQFPMLHKSLIEDSKERVNILQEKFKEQIDDTVLKELYDEFDALQNELDKSETTAKSEIQFEEIASFAAIPVKRHKKDKKDYVEIEIIKAFNGEYYLERLQNIPLNLFLCESDNVKWIQGDGMKIADIDKFEDYLFDCLKFPTDIYTNIAYETDIWSVIKIEDETILRVKIDDKFYDSNYSIFKKYSYIEAYMPNDEQDGNKLSNLLDFLKSIDDTETKNSLAVISAYMFMCQCNSLLVHFFAAPKKRLNVIIGEDKDNVLLCLLQELANCINISCPTGERQDNIVIPSDTKEKTDGIIQNKNDRIILIDDRNGSGTEFQKNMPVIISKEKNTGDKYLNVDITSCIDAEQIIAKLKLSQKMIQNDVKSFYKYFVNHFYSPNDKNDLDNNTDIADKSNDEDDDAEDDTFENILYNIEIIFDEYRETIKEYDSDTVKFCAYLQFFFMMYVEYASFVMNHYNINRRDSEDYDSLKDVRANEAAHWELYAAEFGKNILHITDKMTKI